VKPKIVLCPVDFSPASRVAFDEAVLVAREASARLVLVHVYQALLPPVPELPLISPEVVQRAAVALEAQLAMWRTEAVSRGVTSVETELLEGAPWDRIVEAARTARADLVIMGTQGRTGLRHALLGSVAEKVVRHARCSVLVVRREQEGARS
jgi:universal stress protein A